MARIAGVNIPQNKIVRSALTYIHGIGNKTFNTFFDPPKTCDLKDCGQRKLITRSDDNEETIVKRLKTYDEKTFPVLDYYLKKGIMKNIDGMQEINAISDQLFTIIRAVRS
jgi:adenylate kinase